MRPKFDVTENLEKFCKILGTKQALTDHQTVSRKENFRWYDEVMKRLHAT
jgi:hypothetical protein